MRDVDNSRLLDVHRWSDHPEVNTFVYDLFESEVAPLLLSKFPSGAKPKQPIKYQFKVLILDLYVLWCHDPEACLSVARADNAFKVESRYNAIHISKLIIKCVDALQSLGYVEQKLGSEAAGRVTRIWPTSKLEALFRAARFTEYHVGRCSAQEVIVLNDKVASPKRKYNEETDEASVHFVAKPMEYKDKDYAPIPVMRESLRNYNALLARTFIDIADLERPVLIIKKDKKPVRRIQISQHNKLVRRIFSRGNWSLGGRFYGGWWQQIDSSYRRRIMIDDKPVVEVDYSSLHISLSYALQGLQPPTDPYRLPEVMLKGFDAQAQRAVVKGLILTAINARDLSSTLSAFRSKCDTGTPEKRLKDSQLKPLLNKFIELNEPVAGYIAADKGVELMRIDGNLTAFIMDYFTERDIAILTVHDSYIVPRGYEEELMKVMNSAVKRELGDYKINMKPEVLTAGQIRTSFPSFEDGHLKMEAYRQLAANNTVRCAGYLYRRDMFAAVVKAGV